MQKQTVLFACIKVELEVHQHFICLVQTNSSFTKNMSINAILKQKFSIHGLIIDVALVYLFAVKMFPCGVFCVNLITSYRVWFFLYSKDSTMTSNVTDNIEPI